MSNGEDLISVIVPAYNAAPYLEPAIRSALAQTHAHLEIILVDDGSDDDTAAIAQRLAHEDSRLRLIRTPHQGVSAARNRAIAEAKGDFIAPLDADDLWRPDKLARQLAVFRASPASVGLVYCWCCGIDRHGAVIMPSWSRGTAQGSVLSAIIVEGFVGNGSTPLIRKAAIERCGGYDTSLRLCEDWKLTIALAAICDFAFVPATLCGYRFTDTNSSLTADWEEALAAVTRWIRQSWPQLPEKLLQDREFVLNGFLAFWAARRGAYWDAIRYQARAIRIRPATIFSRAMIDFLGLLAGHAIGWPQYSWHLFQKPKAFLDPIRRD